ncbi:MAG TPA: LacI family DNA-binding transcriptional regulator [Chloroflexota bacterium]|jgi:DNA-binding LacI/PurR family transcriptional regulator|nr:LacI family DNA-binding transcriptional regulator [Chloroflexota bacterium]
MARITLREVAAAAGVSIFTASKALSGQGAGARISPATVEQVRAVALELGYVANQTARNLRAQRTGQLGIVLSFLDTQSPSLLLSLDGGLLAGLSIAARECQLPAVVIYPQPDSTALTDPAPYLDGRIDGLLVRCGMQQEAQLLSLIEPARLPLVAVWRQEVPDGVGFVDADHYGGAYRAVRHLLDLGHRRIAFLFPQAHAAHPHYLARCAGYRAALEDAGVAARSIWCLSDVHQVLTLLRTHEPITAVFAATDLQAAELAGALATNGIQIPRDVSLVGFDDMVGADLIAGGLTTVHHPIQEMAVQAVRNLLALIDGAEAEACRTVVPTPLVVRCSTAPPRT